MTVRNVSLNDMSRVSHEIPDNVKIAIADVVIHFAKMEAALEGLIWTILHLSVDDGRLITRMDARPKIALAKTLAERRGLGISNPKLPDTYWETIDKLRGYRNDVVHSAWLMVDGEIPLAVSYAMKSDEGHIVGDAFSIERLEAIARQCRTVTHFLDRLIDECGKPLPTPLRRRRPPKRTKP